jgi:hypothetical protein
MARASLRTILLVALSALAPADSFGIPVPADATMCVVDEAGREVTRTVAVARAQELLSHSRSYPGTCVSYGPVALLGQGEVRAFGHFADDRKPLALGVVLPATFGTRAAPSGHTLVYGSWNGAVSFLEPMIEEAWMERLRAGPEHETCRPIPQPERVASQGFYPGTYCIRYRPNRQDFTVTLEDFQYRDWWEDRPVDAPTARGP